MINKINFQFAVNATLTLTALVLTYHLLIITGVIPYEAAWGGRLENDTQMIRFESVSIAINLLLLLIVCLKAGYLKWNVSPKLLAGVLWFFACLFALNTLGNLFSTNFWEMVIFTPLTALLAVLFWRMAIEKPKKE